MDHLPHLKDLRAKRWAVRFAVLGSSNFWMGGWAGPVSEPQHVKDYTSRQIRQWVLKFGL